MVVYYLNEMEDQEQHNKKQMRASKTPQGREDVTKRLIEMAKEDQAKRGL